MLHSSMILLLLWLLDFSQAGVTLLGIGGGSGNNNNNDNITGTIKILKIIIYFPSSHLQV
jgi:hypothetical protein